MHVYNLSISLSISLSLYIYIYIYTRMPFASGHVRVLRPIFPDVQQIRSDEYIRSKLQPG